MQEQMYTERYRPNSLDSIVGQDQITSILSEWVDDDSVPHLLFSGPQGTGKTTAARAFAIERFGDQWRQNWMDINASDERGIDTIRNKVRKFAERSVSMGTDSNYKIIFLDEADQLTNQAQSTLRRVMEDYSETTRFILSCNYVNQIIDPIKSRCVPFSFRPIDDSDIKLLLETIATNEGLDYREDALWQIVNVADGDARRAIHLLQTVTNDGEIQSKILDAMATELPTETVEEILQLSVQGEFETAMNMVDTDVLKEAVDPQLFCEKMLQVVQKMDVPGDVKVLMINQIGEHEYRLHQGANPMVHLHSMIANLGMARYVELDNYNRRQF